MRTNKRGKKHCKHSKASFESHQNAGSGESHKASEESDPDFCKDDPDFKDMAKNVLDGKVSWDSVKVQFSSGGKPSWCFHGDSMVDTNEGPMKMSDLATSPNKFVRTSNGFSKVESWIHNDASQEAEFVTMATASGRSLTLTPNHLIYKMSCNGEPNRMTVSAGDIEVGNCVLAEKDGMMVPDEVLSIEKSTKTGIYSPLTADGNIVVDGILASCYSNVDSEGLQKYMFQYISSANQILTSILPESWHRMVFGAEFGRSEAVFGFLEVSKLWVSP